MSSRRRRLLAGLLAAGAAVLVAVVGIRMVPASAGTTPCFVVIDGKIHLNPDCSGSSTPAISAEINIRARISTQWVTAENAGASPLIANRWGVADWEKFGLAMLPDGKVALKALINGRYVTLSGTSLVASKTTVGTTERFTLTNNANGSVSLRASNGNLVSAGSQPLIAAPGGSGSATEFDFVPPPKLLGTIALKVRANDQYVSAASSDGTLHADAREIGPTERFKQWKLAGGTIALQASNGLYVTAENAGASPLIANRNSIGEWESLFVFPNFWPNGNAAITSITNSKYLSVRWSADPNAIGGDISGDLALLAKAEVPYVWESFMIIPL